MRLTDVVTMLLSVSAFVLHTVGMVVPVWWVMDGRDPDGFTRLKLYYGIWMTSSCWNDTCQETTAQMSGDRSWLLGPAVLVLLSSVLLLVAVALNALYLVRAMYGTPLRKLCVLLSSGAGCTIVLAVVIFVKKKAGLTPATARETSDGEPGWALLLSVVGAVLAVVNGVVVGVGVSMNFSNHSHEQDDINLKRNGSSGSNLGTAVSAFPVPDKTVAMVDSRTKM